MVKYTLEDIQLLLYYYNDSKLISYKVRTNFKKQQTSKIQRLYQNITCSKDKPYDFFIRSNSILQVVFI